MELYSHSSNTPLWRGAQLKHRDNFSFYLLDPVVDYCGKFKEMVKCHLEEGRGEERLQQRGLEFSASPRGLLNSS
jgi:hypothetical protein